MAKGSKRPSKSAQIAQAESYKHPEATLPLRPDAGTQPQFKKKKPPQRYRNDSSLAPTLEWDGQNPAREQGEALIAKIQTLAAELASHSAETRQQAAALLDLFNPEPTATALPGANPRARRRAGNLLRCGHANHPAAGIRRKTRAWAGRF